MYIVSVHINMCGYGSIPITDVFVTTQHHRYAMCYMYMYIQLPKGLYDNYLVMCFLPESITSKVHQLLGHYTYPI